MFSIICVYNNERILNDNLLSSLRSQDVDYELILVDNTKNEFKSAGKALNYGASKATCKHLLFVHQDVAFPTSSYLRKAEEYINNYLKNDRFVAGVAGIGYKGERVGYVVNRTKTNAHVWGGKISPNPYPVQTLDSCFQIIPSSLFRLLKFDENVPGWHMYVEDYCLMASYLGVKSVVLPFGIIHNSELRSLSSNIFRAEVYLYCKHKKRNKHIYTVMGEISLCRLIMDAFRAKNSTLFKLTFKQGTKVPLKNLLRGKKC